MRKKSLSLISVRYVVLNVVVPLLSLGVPLLFLTLSHAPPEGAFRAILCNGTIVFYAALSTAMSYVKAFTLDDTGLLGELHLLHLIPIAMVLFCGSVYGQVVQPSLPGNHLARPFFDEQNLINFSIAVLCLSILYGITVELFIERGKKK